MRKILQTTISNSCCNARHKDEFGFYCPERIVGLDEESQPGYFGVIKEEGDDQSFQ
jgi:hypothetical protein